MTQRLALLLALTIPLSACVSYGPEETAQRAEAVAATIVARLYPGLSTGPTANCIRDNASAAELNALSSYADNVAGEAQILVLDIAQRPETTACLAANGITLT